MSTEPSHGHGESGRDAARAADAAGAAEVTEATSSADAAGERSVRVRRHRATVVAVAAAVLAAGGGGAWWASAAGGGPAATGSASEPPKLALDGLAAAGQSGKDGGGRPGIAPGEPHPRVYRAAGELPEGPASAPVYRSPASVGRASVSALAEALGVEGQPEKKDGRWVVAGDGKAPGGTALTVNDGRMPGNWTYHSEDGRPVMRCGKPLPTVPGSAGFVPPEQGPGGGSPAPCPEMPGSGEGDPVSEKKAESALRPLLKTLKLGGARLDAGLTAGSLRMVTATPEIGGMPARDWTSTFTVDEDGEVVRAHGNLGELRRGDSYPVMSAKKTLEHLNEHGGGTVSGGLDRPQTYGGDVRGEAEAGPGGKPAPGKALEVTDAEFGLATRYSDGRPVLVPSWIYQVRLGGGHPLTVAHPAVEPEYLKPAKPGRPDPLPEPGGGSRPAPAPGTGSGAGKADEPDSGPLQAAESYEADGRTLKVTFWGGVCGGYEATAEESGKSVKVSVRPEETDPGKVCVKMAERRTVEIGLDRALDGRKVVDAADGDALPRK